MRPCMSDQAASKWEADVRGAHADCRRLPHGFDCSFNINYNGGRKAVRVVEVDAEGSASGSTFSGSHNGSARGSHSGQQGWQHNEKRWRHRLKRRLAK